MRNEAFWHPFTPEPHPATAKVLITSAKGAHVFDSHGKAYFDATSSWWCILHGHCHPRLVNALSAQALTLDQILPSPHAHPVALQLSSELVGKLGTNFSKVFFSDDGSTAVEAALKMSLQYWKNKRVKGRQRFLSLDRGYHGETLGAASVSQIGEFNIGSAEGYATVKLPSPYCYRCFLNLNYPSCAIQCLEDAKKLIRTRGHEFAALIIEPLVMGAAGMIVYPKDFLKELVTLCREREILIIFDEVFTGFGRTGKLFAMEHLDVSPDIVCLSKGLTSGMMPLGATVASSKVWDAFRGEGNTFYHGHTFTANALSCRVALESLKIFEEDGVLEKNISLIKLMEKERDRFMDLSHVGEARSLGMIWAIELVRDKRNKERPLPANGPGWKIANELWHEGVWLRPLHQMIYVVPPYCSRTSELERLFSLLYAEVKNESHFQ